MNNKYISIMKLGGSIMWFGAGAVAMYFMKDKVKKLLNSDSKAALARSYYMNAIPYHAGKYRYR